MRYKEGDVVVVPYTWRNEDGNIEYKLRPAVIYRVESDTEHLILQCTTTNRSNQFPGKWVLKDSDQGRQMGIDANTFIHFDERKIFPERLVKRLIGTCPFMKEIRQHFDEDFDE